MKILFASTNPGKCLEVKNVCATFQLEILSPDELAPSLGPAPEVEENGTSYFENARLKAEALYQWSRMPTLADDTGLEVSALKGRPGLYSARYAGPTESPVEKLLKEMQSNRVRQAQFRCAVYMKLNQNEHRAAEACISGEISYESRGRGGFGYDSVFWIPSLSKTLAEIKEQKISFKTHRYLALEKLFTQTN